MRIAFSLLGAELFALEVDMAGASEGLEAGSGGQFELARDDYDDAPGDRQRVGFTRSVL